MIFIKYPFVQVYFLKTGGWYFFIFYKKNVHPRKAFIIRRKRSFLYDNKNQIPERRSLSGIWFLFSIFTAFRY